MKMPVTPFARAWATLTDREETVLLGRCRGETLQEIADAQYVSRKSVKNHLTAAYTKLRQGAGLEHTRSWGISGAVCWRLGYEQALDDIDAHLAKKQRAA